MRSERQALWPTEGVWCFSHFSCWLWACSGREAYMVSLVTQRPYCMHTTLSLVPPPWLHGPLALLGICQTLFCLSYLISLEKKKKTQILFLRLMMQLHPSYHLDFCLKPSPCIADLIMLLSPTPHHVSSSIPKDALYLSFALFFLQSIYGDLTFIIIFYFLMFCQPHQNANAT